ncbi:MAG: uracil-DNA glycosylase [Chloroflexi bacterium]|nr:uracil-DNA glycosylase [Chloroflexota bacterium]
MEAQTELEKLVSEVKACRLCPLASGRTLAVPGEGPSTARVMFIGEGPGFHEDRQGRPFVGAAGQLLETLLKGIGLSREDVYITNVVKCRPPGNRDPEAQEVEACRPYLERQIELLRPAVIVTLGRFSMARYFPNTSITRVHGQAKRVGRSWVIPVFHPAAALHQPRYRPELEQDFQKVADLLAKADAPVAAESPSEGRAEQLPLF